MVESSASKTPAAVVASVSPGQASYVEWPAILGGAVVASAVAFVLSAFGTALGLSLVSPFRGESVPAPGLVIAIGLWILWVAGTSFMAGGYIAGRLRRRVNDATEHEVEIRDGVHGAVVWGVATLIGAGLLALGAYGTGNIASRGLAAAATTAAAATRPSSDDGPYALIVDKVFRAGDEVVKPGAEAARRITARMITASVAEGKIAEADRTYLAKLVAARTGIPEPEAQARVDQADKDAAAVSEKAKQAANVARKVGIVAAFMIAVSLLIGAAIAWWAAGLGGRHRDEQTVFAWVRWR